MIPNFVHKAIDQLRVDVDAQMLRVMARFLDLLQKTNQQFNLTGIQDRDEMWRRHIIDSLTLLPWIEDSAGLPKKIIDVGTGGGVPGIPIAIARPDLRLTLLDATAKKTRFCQQCISDLGLAQVDVVNERAETIGQHPDHRQQYDAAACRALGPMRQLLEYTLPLVRTGGQVLAMKGPKAEAELAESADAMHLLGAGKLEVFDAYPPGFDKNTVIVVIHKASATPPQYPRPPGMPRQSPL